MLLWLYLLRTFSINRKFRVDYLKKLIIHTTFCYIAGASWIHIWAGEIFTGLSAHLREILLGSLHRGLVFVCGGAIVSLSVPVDGHIMSVLYGCRHLLP